MGNGEAAEIMLRESPAVSLLVDQNKDWARELYLHNKKKTLRSQQTNALNVMTFTSCIPMAND